MSMINREIDDFSVQAFQDDGFTTVTKDDVLGHWSVFFFYPADFTFVCPTELVDMADKYDRFKAMGVEIYSVSTDTHFVHKAWHDTSESIRKINYPMLADPTGVLSRGFGVMIEEEGVATAARSSSTPRGRSSWWKSRTTASAAMPMSCCVKSPRHSSSRRTRAKYAPPNGSTRRALKPSIDLVGKI